MKAGETAAPGVPVVMLADLSNWLVETDDLTEIKVPNIKEGQAVDRSLRCAAGCGAEGRGGIDRDVVSDQQRRHRLSGEDQVDRYRSAPALGHDGLGGI